MYSRLLPLISGLLLCACGAPKEHYYLLTPASKLPGGRSSLSLGVGPVTMPEYLHEDKLTSMGEGNELLQAHSHLWAGDLGKNAARVLATNLGGRLGTADVQVYPWQNDGGVDYQVSVNVIHFHGTNHGTALLEARWSVYRLPSSRLVGSRTSRIEVPLERDGFNALAAAQSGCLDRLAAEIAPVIRR